MLEKKTIEELEKEFNRLSLQLSQQQQELNRLRQQLYLHQTNTGAAPAKRPAPASLFSSFAPVSLENIIGLRLIHLVGIVVLVIGLSLGVKYAIDKNLVSEALRIALAYAAGGLLFALSLWLQKSYESFAAVLFSGAMASLYFTTYGACVYYQFLSYPTAFAVMAVLTVFTTYRALVQNRQIIALLGLVGAYGIPFLISPNRGHPEQLFLYISLINTGVVFVSVRKPWRLVGRIAQGITWLLFIGWAAWQSRDLQAYGPLFMVLFFVLFALVALLPKWAQGQRLSKDSVYQLLTNNLAFYLATLFVFGYANSNANAAYLSLFFSGLTLAQAVVFYFWKEPFATKMMAYAALILLVLFIGIQWKGMAVTLLWLGTAIVLFAAGVQLKSIPARMAAITLMGVTLLKLVLLDSLTFSTLQKIIAYLVLGVLLLLVSYFYQRFRQRLFGGESSNGS